MKNSSINKSTRGILFLYFCIFALLCDAFVAYYLIHGRLLIWRQFLFVVASYLLVREIRYFHEFKLKLFFKIVFVCFLYYIVRGVFTYFDLGFNVVRIFYAVWIAFCGVPFMLLPYFVLKQGWTMSSLFKFICTLGTFYGVGLIVDGMSGGYFAYLYHNNSEITLDQLESEGRYSFFSMHVTTTGVFMSLCTLSALYLMSKGKRIINQFYYLCCALCMLGGIWFTGARQSLIPMLLNILCGIFLYLIMVKRNKIALSFLLVCVLPLIVIKLATSLSNVSQENLSKRYAKSAFADDSRSSLWMLGWNEVVMDPAVFVFGKGVGYVGVKARSGEVFGNNYENTYFSRISCVGLIDAFLLLFPLLYILFVVFKQRPRQFLDMLLLLFVCDYVFIAFVSPNGSTPTAQVAVYIGCGIAWTRKFHKKLELIYGKDKLQ